VRAAAAEPTYGYLLYCTTAPSVLGCLLCDEHALQCPPWSLRILCDCASVDYLSLSTSFNNAHLQVHCLPLFELLCERRFIVVTRVDVLSSEVAHMPIPTNHPSPLNYLPSLIQPLTPHPPFGLLPQPRSTDRHADNVDTRIGYVTHGSPTAFRRTSLSGSRAVLYAAGRDVPAAAAQPWYGYLLSCTTAPSIFFLCFCFDRALQCPPWSPGILCECAGVFCNLSLSTSFNNAHPKEHG
jgi:hypothetical protein